MEKQSLETYFEGKANKKLSAQIETWASASKENSQQFAKDKADWTFRHFPNEPADVDDFLRFAQYEKPDGEPWRLVKRKRIWYRFYRVAAIITIPLLITSIYFQIRETHRHKEQEMNSLMLLLRPQQGETLIDYIINPGVKGKVSLPDGSTVWLNSHSVLRTPNLFDTISRIVELDGEGYFIVEGSNDWPFYVQTKKGVTIMVTGTEFNLSSYANDPFLKVTMVQGSLTLIEDNSLKTIILQNKEEIVLANNYFGKSNPSSAKKVKEDTSWKEGYLMFDNTPIDAVVRKMERWFGVTITIQDAQILNYRITAEFESESLIQVLEIFKISSQIKYQVNGNQVSLYL